MKKKNILLVLLALVTTANAWSQRGKRAIERIDRDVQTRVFIPKGTWMAGGTVSYSEHEQDNLNFLVIKDVEGNGYDFSISPYMGYFFRNNMAAGIRFAYNRDYSPSTTSTTWSTNTKCPGSSVPIFPLDVARCSVSSTKCDSLTATARERTLPARAPSMTELIRRYRTSRSALRRD